MMALKWASVILVIVGGINLGLQGIFSFDLVGTIMGPVPMLVRVLNAFIGFAAVYLITVAPKLLK